MGTENGKGPGKLILSEGRGGDSTVEAVEEGKVIEGMVK